MFRIVYAINSRMTDFLLRNPYLYKFSNSAKTQSDAVRVLHGFTESVIRKRKHELSVEQNDNAGQCDEIGIRKKRALLDLLLQSEIDGKPLSDLDIREEVDTFMFEVNISNRFFSSNFSVHDVILSQFKRVRLFILRVTIPQHLVLHSHCTILLNMRKFKGNV